MSMLIRIYDFLNTQNNQWRRLKRQSTDIRFVSVNIFYNQIVEYKKNVLIVRNSEGEVYRYG